MAVAVAAAWPASAHATLPGQNGLIAYGRSMLVTRPEDGATTTSNAAAHLIAPDGSGDRQLGDPSEFGGGIGWAADGRRVLVARGTDRYDSRLATLDLDDPTRPPQDVPCPVACRSGAWMADGRLLVILETNPQTLVSMNVDGSGARVVTTAPAGGALQEPAAAADGRHVAWVTITGNVANPATVMVADADGTLPTRIAFGVAPDFAPDGQSVAYASDDPADGPHPRWAMVSNLSGAVRTPVAPSGDLRQERVTWSPDGTQLVVQAITAEFAFPPKTSLIAVRAPSGGRSQPPGADSPGCLRGYRVVVDGIVGGPSWGTRPAPPGAGTSPASVPCPVVGPTMGATAVPPVAGSPLSPALSARATSARGRLVIRVRTRRGAHGTLKATATLGGRSLRLLRQEGPKRLRTYRFAVRRSGRATARVRFTGTDGWSSAVVVKRISVRAQGPRARR